MTPGRTFRERLSSGRAILIPGVFDALSARIATECGFEALFVSGFSASATLLAEPDFGLLTQTEMVDCARRICAATSLPVLVDGDTGYGDPLNVIRTVREYERLGAAGILIEDQVWPKRCGHMENKRVISCAQHVRKISAALDARQDPDFFVIARTDARQPLGLAEAIRRGQAYKQAGADAVFVEAPQSLDEMKRVADAIEGPLMANMLEGGVTPLQTLKTLQAINHLIVASPLCGLLAAARAMRSVYETLARTGSTESVTESLMDFDAFNNLVGLPEKYALSERYGQS